MTLRQVVALLPLLVTSLTIVWLMSVIALGRGHGRIVVFALLGFSLATATMFATDTPVVVADLLSIDAYSHLYMSLILGSAFVVAILLHGHLRLRHEGPEEIYLLLALSVLGGLVVVSSRHFAAFFLGLEVMAIPLYAMVGYLVSDKRALEASMKYLVLSAVASAFTLFGMALLYSQTGTLSFHDVGIRFKELDALGNRVVVVGAGMLLVGVGIKLSFAPFHLWVPDVFEGAPAPVAAYLATVSKVAVFAVLVRLFIEGHLYSSDVLMDILSVNAVLSIVLGNLLALLQTNLKRLLAYSSIAHFGYVLVAFIAAGAGATESVGVYLVAYVLTTLAAFAVVTLISGAANRAPGDREQYLALFWRAPYLAVGLTIALLSLAGIPMTAGFIAKFYVINAGLNARVWILLGAVLFGSAVGLFYYIRVLVDLYRPPDRDALDRVSTGHRSSLGGLFGHAASGGVLLALLVLILAFGLYPSPLIAWVQAAGMN